MFCSKCGAAVAEGSPFCGTCGNPIAQIASTIPVRPISAEYSASIPAIYQPAFAGFWLRFVAAFIDGFVLVIPIIMIILIFIAEAGLGGVIRNIHAGEPPQEVIGLIGVGLFFGCIALIFIRSWLYFAAMESSAWQATLGKKVLGIYVTDLSGNRVTFGRASGRYFGKVMFQFVPFIGGLFLYPIDCIMAGFTEKKQALHDMIASCLVMRKA